MCEVTTLVVILKGNLDKMVLDLDVFFVFVHTY